LNLRKVFDARQIGLLYKNIKQSQEFKTL